MRRKPDPLLRLKTASHGDDGKWAYDEIVSLRKQRDELLAALTGLVEEKQSLGIDRAAYQNAIALIIRIGAA